jgi:hypothetical protein
MVQMLQSNVVWGRAAARCVVARGTTIIGTRAVPTVTGTYPITSTTISGFVWCPMTLSVGRPVNPVAYWARDGATI